MAAPREIADRLYQRLLTSERFQRYQQAFRTATGLPLRLANSDPDAWCLDDEIENRSPFCERINLCHTACGACREVNRRLMIEAEVKGPTSCHCFSGMTATAVPVRFGASTIAFLKTGQVFQNTPSEQMFEQTIDLIGRKSLTAEEIGRLRSAYFSTRSINPERYRSMVELLSVFAEQLSNDAEEAALVEDGREPETVKKALSYIHAHLDERLALGDVSRTVGMSESHFCRLFKDSVGLTFTEYINHARVEWARRELLRPAARVSEIAFQVGFQSLSQFNRSFSRITGRTPTEFRKEKFAGAA